MSAVARAARSRRRRHGLVDADVHAVVGREGRVPPAARAVRRAFFPRAGMGGVAYSRPRTYWFRKLR